MQLDVLSGQVLGQAGEILIVDISVTVDIQRSGGVFHILSGQVLRQPGEVLVVDAAVAVDVAGDVGGGGIYDGKLLLPLTDRRIGQTTLKLDHAGIDDNIVFRVEIEHGVTVSRLDDQSSFIIRDSYIAAGSGFERILLC